MKKLVFAFVVAAIAAIGLGASAHADTGATVCGSVQIQVNGDDVVNEATCQVLPPS